MSRTLYLVLNERRLFVRILLRSMKTFFAWATLDLISWSDLPSDVTTAPKYLKLLTCFQMCPFRVMLHAGLSFFFVMTIVFIFVVLILRLTASLSLSMMSIFTPRSHVILFYIESNQRSLTIPEGRMYA